jgi:signal peptidase II
MSEIQNPQGDPLTKFKPVKKTAVRARNRLDKAIGLAAQAQVGNASQLMAYKKPRIFPWFLFAIFLIVLDQATKLWVVNTLYLGASEEILPFFNLVYVLNPGAAFSFLANQPGWQRYFLSAIALVTSVIIMFMMRSARHRPWAMLCLASILGGALGNLVDRLLYGAVVDFLDFYWGNFHWPAFNVADMAITLGAIGLVLTEWFGQPKAQASSQQALPDVQTPTVNTRH